MFRRRSALSVLAAAVLCLPASLPADRDDRRPLERVKDWQTCEQVSFDPLSDTVPACTRLIDEGSLEATGLIEALLARARANIVALTYRYDDKVTDGHLWQRVLADADRAVAAARALEPPQPEFFVRALRKRGEARRMTGDLPGALADYTETLATAGDTAGFLLGSRARVHAAMGRYDEAIADMTAAIRIAPETGRSNLHNWIFERGEMYEAAGDTDAAIADYRRTLKTDPGHIRANQALVRLGAKRVP